MIAKKKAEIEFGGQMRTFYFGIGFLGMFVENTTNTLATLEDNLLKNPFKVLPELMYYSLLYGYLKQKSPERTNKLGFININQTLIVPWKELSHLIVT